MKLPGRRRSRCFAALVVALCALAWFRQELALVHYSGTLESWLLAHDLDAPPLALPSRRVETREEGPGESARRWQALGARPRAARGPLDFTLPLAPATEAACRRFQFRAPESGTPACHGSPLLAAREYLSAEGRLAFAASAYVRRVWQAPAVCTPYNCRQPELRGYAGRGVSAAWLGEGSAPAPSTLALAPSLRGASERAVARYGYLFHSPPPNIFVVVLDSVSRCRLAHYCPGLLSWLCGAGLPATHEHFELRQFHTVADGTTVFHMTPTFSGTEYQGQNSLMYHSSVPAARWIWSHLRARGYVATLAGTNVVGKSRHSPNIMELFDAMAPPLDKLFGFDEVQGCVGGKNVFEQYLSWLRASAVASDAPVFGTTQNFEAHHFPQNAGVFDQPQVVSELRALLEAEPHTALVLMSDHGHRRDAHSEPMLHLVLPSALLDEPRMAGARAALRANADRLVTHYDVHQTLKHLGDASILGELVPDDDPAIARLLPEGAAFRPQSLLTEVPADRTSEEAGFHWVHAATSVPPASERYAPDRVPEAHALAAALVAAELEAEARQYPINCPSGLRVHRLLNATTELRFDFARPVLQLRAQFTVNLAPAFVFEAQRTTDEATGEVLKEKLTPVSRYKPLQTCAPATMVRVYACFCTGV